MPYEDLKPPARLPEPGFYYHYKHDPEMLRDDCPDADIRNYAYEVLPSFGLYTEETDEDLFHVDYLPLYPWAKVYEISRAVGRICEDHRPVSMFLQDVETSTYKGPRFRKITDAALIKRLTEVRDQMYGIFPPK